MNKIALSIEIIIILWEIVNFKLTWLPGCVDAHVKQH